MLQAVPGDAPVDARLGVVVAGNTLPLLIGPLPVLPEASPHAHLSPLGRTVEADLHGVGIVDGDRPTCGSRPIDAGP